MLHPQNEPTSCDDINVELREQPYSVSSSTSTMALLFGGFTDCMQPVRTVYTSMKGCEYLVYKILVVESIRDYYWNLSYPIDYNWTLSYALK